MRFQVMSQLKAVKFSKETHTEKTAIISITNTNAPKVKFFDKANIDSVLHLSFDDTERNNKTNGKPITARDAKRIVSFVNTCITNGTELLIVHCTAGISRGTGVCAGIMKATTGNDTQIFGDARFCPNMTCYSTVLGAFMCPEDINETKCVL